MSQTLPEVNQHIIQQWLIDNMDIDQIKEKLLIQGMNQVTIDEYLSAFDKAKIARKQTSGFIFMAIGALVGFIGCIIAIIHPSSAVYYMGLYGLTSIAVILVFIGLYKLME